MIKKGDFIELEYTGRIKIDNRIFDTTHEDLAKKEGIKSQGMKYGPIVICVGEKNVLPYLDKELENKEIGNEYEVEVRAEDGFGKKDPKLIRIVPMSVFKKQNMTPYPGLQINAEGSFGVIRSVSGGRVTVDFNHPLAGRDIVYSFKIIAKVDDVEKQVECVAKFNLFLDHRLYDLRINVDKVVVSPKIEIPEQIKKNFEEKVTELVPKIKKVEFSIGEKKEKRNDH